MLIAYEMNTLPLTMQARREQGTGIANRHHSAIKAVLALTNSSPSNDYAAGMIEQMGRTKGKPGESFKNLLVWQRSIELSLAVYKLTAAFPSNEQFGLTAQMRRAAVSIASNIAEGYGRSTRGEYILFLGHSRGSNCELQTQLIIVEKLGLGNPKARLEAQSLAEEVSRMLSAIMTRLKPAG